MREARTLWGVRTGLVLAGAASLCACADAVRALGPAPVDPASPIAAQVTAAERTHRPTPSFRDVPPVPANVRADSSVRTDMAATLTERSRLQAAANALPPPPADTEAFAAAGRASIPAEELAAPPPDSAAGTEDAAERLRALAKPPPPPR